MILIHLDGAGPLGDPYQVDSANHGPYGAAVTRELIPFIERKFRGIGDGHARALDGGSTGGWVALALQVFYPDLFNGAWAFCPDSVDFRSFQLVNIYEDDNAYSDWRGHEQPAVRDVSGQVRFTMRQECQLENVLGRGDSWHSPAVSGEPGTRPTGPGVATVVRFHSGTRSLERSTTGLQATGEPMTFVG